VLFVVMPTNQDIPQCPEDWISIAERELSNISASYQGKVSGDSKIDHAVKATEAMLKAVLWKHEKFNSWPTKTDKVYKFVYSHNLDVFLEKCGLSARLKKDPKHWASWRTLVNASVNSPRYARTIPPEAVVNQIIKSARHPDVGIVPWLQAQFHKMS
jgi:hypothetical protein